MVLSYIQNIEKPFKTCVANWIQQIKSNSDVPQGVTLKQMKIQQIIVPEDWKWKDKAK